MKRVCVLLRSLAPGGAEKQALLVTLALRAAYSASLVVLDDEPRSPRHLHFLEEHRLEVRFLPRGRARKVAALWGGLRRPPVFALFGFLPSDTALGAVVARLAGVERVHGGLRNSRLAPGKERVLRFVHNHVSHLTIANSFAARDHFAARGFAPAKLRVIPNGIFVCPPRPARARTGPVTALCVARFVPEKGLDTALAVLQRARAHSSTPELRLVLAGEGPLRADLQARVAALGLAEAVEIVSPAGDTRALFERSDLYLSTSHFEGLSNSILEAQDASLPVLATDVGDNARLVEEGVSGHLAALGDVETLAAAWVALARDPERRGRFGAAGHAHVARHHSFEALRSAYLALLEEPLST
jgi:glycosyltransferase involved in cell wall biosynthesis